MDQYLWITPGSLYYNNNRVKLLKQYMKTIIAKYLPEINGGKNRERDPLVYTLFW